MSAINRLNQLAHSEHPQGAIEALGKELRRANLTAPLPPAGTTAQTRGMVLLCLPIGVLPPGAFDAARAACKMYGMCSEVMLDAYTTYARTDEGCP